MRRVDSGAVLLEILVAMVISMFVYAALTNSLHLSAKFHYKMREAKQELVAAFIFKSELQEAANGLDSFRALSTVIIHGKGELNFADSTPNPAVLRGSDHQPDPNSNAFTRVTLDSEQVLKITEVAQQGQRLKVQYINLSGSNAPYAPNLIGYSVDGTIELIREGSPTDAEMTVRLPSRSMIARQYQFDPRTIRAMIPIEEIVTIYLDRRGELRYLSHLGEQNIESQPLEKGIRAIELLRAETSPGFTSIRATLTLNSGRALRMTSFSRLQTIDSFNFLFNL